MSLRLGQDRINYSSRRRPGIRGPLDGVGGFQYDSGRIGRLDGRWGHTGRESPLDVVAGDRPDTLGTHRTRWGVRCGGSRGRALTVTVLGAACRGRASAGRRRGAVSGPLRGPWTLRDGEERRCGSAGGGSRSHGGHGGLRRGGVDPTAAGAAHGPAAVWRAPCSERLHDPARVVKSDSKNTEGNIRPNIPPPQGLHKRLRCQNTFWGLGAGASWGKITRHPPRRQTRQGQLSSYK